MPAPTASPRPAGALLGPDDPPPFELVNAGGSARFLLVCDHASDRIPASLGRLGLDAAALGRHIAIDIGAGDLTRALAERLDARAVLAGYSRLVIDANRRLDDPTSIPEISDGTVVPGNRALDAAAREARAAALFRPYQAAIADALAVLDREAGAAPLIAIHSFTPVFRGEERPWHVGLLWDRDPRVPRPLFEALARRPGLVVGDNVPYSARDPYGHTMLEHADSKGRANVLIEVRQDLIDTRHGVDTWAGILGPALAEVLADDGLYRAEPRP